MCVRMLFVHMYVCMCEREKKCTYVQYMYTVHTYIHTVCAIQRMKCHIRTYIRTYYTYTYMLEYIHTYIRMSHKRSTNLYIRTYVHQTHLTVSLECELFQRAFHTELSREELCPSQSAAANGNSQRRKL